MGVAQKEKIYYTISNKITQAGEDSHMDWVEKRLVTNQVVLDVGYDRENMAKGYDGPVHIDYYGRKVPKSAHGTVSLQRVMLSILLHRPEQLRRSGEKDRPLFYLEV